MENLDIYTLLKQMLQKHLLVIRSSELEDLLSRYVAQGRIKDEERKDLLLLAEYLVLGK